MKKIILFNIYICILLFFCLAEDFIPVEYRIEKGVLNYNVIEKIKVDNLYEKEEDAVKYVDFLLKEKKLNIDYSAFYSAYLQDNNDVWLVSLFLSIENQKDIIFDTLDFPIKYVFCLDKATGKISELSLVR